MEYDNLDILKLAANLVASYVGNNRLDKQDLAPLVREVYLSLLETKDMQPEIKVEKPVPAIAVEKSLKSDRIYCLECGQSYKSLKRHLRTAHKTVPTAYREKWDLPADYPMIAPDYSRQRSSLAKRSGLGKS